MAHDNIVARWFQYQESPETTTLIGTSGRTNVYAQEDALYSYGSHFPLVVPIRDSAGALELYLLNGDRYSNTTTRHQAMVRSHAAGAVVPFIIVPFSALTSARIDRDTIRAVEIRPDRLELVTRRCTRAHRYWNDGAMQYQACEGGTEHITRQHFLGDSVFVATVRESIGYQESERRNVRFISSFDYQEPRALYFLAELPAFSRAETVDEALIDLRPELVRKADESAREVVRQGDIFAVEPRLPITRGMLRSAGVTFTKRTSLFGTAHTATEVATNETTGETWARGMLRHEPGIIAQSWRRPDHIRRRIGDGKSWYRIVPNTVPRGTRGTLGTRAIAAPRAWTISGNVD